jgi:hypothetical protein
MEPNLSQNDDDATREFVGRVSVPCLIGTEMDATFGFNFALICTPIPVSNEHSASSTKCHVTGNGLWIELLDWTKSIVVINSDPILLWRHSFPYFCQVRSPHGSDILNKQTNNKLELESINGGRKRTNS